MDKPKISYWKCLVQLITDRRMLFWIAFLLVFELGFIYLLPSEIETALLSIVGVFAFIAFCAELMRGSIQILINGADEEHKVFIDDYDEIINILV
jgi:hypothetical protein